MGGGVITSYSSTLLKSYGFTPPIAALLNTPAGLINITVTLAGGAAARYFGGRWIWLCLILALSVLGAALLAWMPKGNRSGALAGVYLVNCIVGAAPLSWQWIMSNTAGHTKRAFVAAMMNLSFGIGNIVGPLTFQAKEAPGYHTAKLALMCCWAVTLPITIGLRVYYGVVNTKRDKAVGTLVGSEEDVSAAKGFAGLTDKQNKDFRYTY